MSSSNGEGINGSVSQFNNFTILNIVLSNIRIMGLSVSDCNTRLINLKHRSVIFKIINNCVNNSDKL